MRARRLGMLTAFCVVAGLTVGMTTSDPSAHAATATTAPAAVTAPGPAVAKRPVSTVPRAPRVLGKQPNIVMITADDMRADDLELMPRTQRLLGRAGVTFTDAVSNYPLCCPARASLLTGQYSHNNGVQGNEWPYGGHRKFYESGAEEETLPVWLQRAGYNTAFVGKYLNYYGSADPVQGSTGPWYIPPGWNDWHATYGRVFRYHCPTMNHNGSLRRHRGQYQTDLFSRLSTDLIDTYAKADRPFFLWTSHLAPHAGGTGSAQDGCVDVPGLPTPAAERHERMFEGISLPKSPALNEKDMSDKGTYMRDRGKLDLHRQAVVHQARLQALQSLDESVAETVTALDRRGVLDETLIVFASDNGWLLGEHRAEKKILPYEESLRVPLLVRGPDLPAGVRRHQPVGIVDVTATALAVAGATPTKPQDGVSLSGLARDPRRLARRVMPIESGPVPAVQGKHNTVQPAWYYRGVRSSRWSYIAWQLNEGIEEEFYDLDRDPYQETSAHGTESAALEAARVAQQLLQDCVGQACVMELPAAVEDGSPRPGPAGDTVRPQVGVVRAPKGWIRSTRAVVRYTASDRTDRARALSHWCSHQARDCDGTATLHLSGEGRHSWTIHVTDRADNVGSAYGNLGVDLFAPRVRSTHPRDEVRDGGRARLGWKLKDTASGVKRVDTRIRTVALDGPPTPWAYPARMQNRKRPVRAVALPRDNATVCVEIRARDRAGRQTRWTQVQCRARAIDAAALVPDTEAAWKSVARQGWYAGTGTTARTRGAALTVPSTGPVGLVRVVARAGAGMGRVRVEVGGKTVGRIALDRAGRGLQEFVLPTAGKAGPVTVTVTSKGRPVWLDSVGVIRRAGS
ncbi:sulfatase family protein [Nocardioides pakistanensis]